MHGSVSQKSGKFIPTFVEPMFGQTTDLTAIRFKARIRIYLECFGCSLIVAGFLLIFLGSKIQGNPALCWTKDLKDENDSGTHWSPPFELPFISWQPGERPRSCAAIERQVRESASNALDLPVLMGGVESAKQPNLSSSGCLINTKYNSDSDHKPAVETALSTVLTVSTLAGYHDTSIGACGSCCLYHMVQVSWIDCLP